MSPFTQLFLLGTPYWALAVLALATTGTPRIPGARRLWLRNRYSYLGLMLLAAVIVMIVALNVGFGIGGCSGGMIDPIVCTNIGDQTGAALYEYEFHALITTSAIGTPSLGAYLLAEVITRWRAARR